MPRADGEKLASEYGLKFFETSVRATLRTGRAGCLETHNTTHARRLEGKHTL